MTPNIYETTPFAPANFTNPAAAQIIGPTAELATSLPVQPAPSPPVAARRTSASVDLPDGRTVMIRRATGYDVRNANRLGEGDDAMVGLALASSVSSINGNPIVFNDFLAMDWADIQKIVKEYHSLMGN